MHVYLLRFGSVCELARALGELYEDIELSGLQVDRGTREIRVQADALRLTPHLERFYLRRSLLWCTRHPLASSAHQGVD